MDTWRIYLLYAESYPDPPLCSRWSRASHPFACMDRFFINSTAARCSSLAVLFWLDLHGCCNAEQSRLVGTVSHRTVRTTSSGLVSVRSEWNGLGRQLISVT